MKNTIATDLLIKAHMNPEEMINQEILWENHQIEQGVAKYQELMESKTLDATTGGIKLLKSVISKTIEGMKEALEEVDAKMSKSGQRGRDSQVWAYCLPLVTPEQASIIAVNTVISYCDSPKMADSGYTGLVRRLAEALKTQSDFENWKKVSKESIKGKTDKKGKQLKKSPAQMMTEKHKGSIDRKKLRRWASQFEDYTTSEWSEEVMTNVGAKMLSVVCNSNPDTFVFTQKMSMGKTLRTVHMSDAAWQLISDCEGFAELQRPFLLPTLIKPVPYAYRDGKVTGGYHHISTSFFSRGLYAHSAANPEAASQTLLNAVNAIQETPWTINKFIFETLGVVTGSKQAIKGVELKTNEEMPARISQEAFASLTKEEKIAFKEEISKKESEIASAKGRFCSFQRKLKIANMLLPHERFYFPHFSDFRTRLYPLPQELTPQGDKIAKALLQFADGKKLGATGLKWLMIHAANTYGMDKESLENREQWVKDNLDMIHAVATQPIFNKQWTKADEPFGFLAAAKEISEAVSLDDPSEYMSHLPCAMDGTVNGMQILSLIGKDTKGATATNCMSGMARQDLYSEVAVAVIAILKEQAGECAISAEWYEMLSASKKLARDVVKQPVMTTPYGVTKKGMEDQLINKKFCNDFISGSRVDVAKVMATTITAAMSSVNGKAVEIMEYLQASALVMCENNLPFSWTTPTGSKVTQAYNNLAEKRVQTVFGDVRLQVEDKVVGMNAMRTANGSSPNVIHSFDAAMLQMTVIKMHEAGYSDFAMIHDSYGVHASGTEDLHVALREVALDIFGGNVLEGIRDYLATQTDSDLPEIPTLGDYDVTEILNAPYFFS